jgi:hypothetical protein
VKERVTYAISQCRSFRQKSKIISAVFPLFLLEHKIIDIIKVETSDKKQ